MDKTVRTAVALVECYVSAEILWHFFNPSGPRLYELAAEYALKLRDRLAYQMEVSATLRSIRRLPEHDA